MIGAVAGWGSPAGRKWWIAFLREQAPLNYTICQYGIHPGSPRPGPWTTPHHQTPSLPLCECAPPHPFPHHDMLTHAPPPQELKQQSKQLAAAEQRGALLLQQLEGAEVSLRGSQGAASRLLQEAEGQSGQAARWAAEVAELQRALVDRELQLKQLEDQLAVTKATAGTATTSGTGLWTQGLPPGGHSPHAALKPEHAPQLQLTLYHGGGASPLGGSSSQALAGVQGSREQLVRQLVELAASNTQLEAARVAALAECEGLR